MSDTVVQPMDAKALSEAIASIPSSEPTPTPAPQSTPTADAPSAETLNTEAPAGESTEELPFHAHPRWKEKLEQERQLKAELEQLKAVQPYADWGKGLMEQLQQKPKVAAMLLEQLQDEQAEALANGESPPDDNPLLERLAKVEQTLTAQQQKERALTSHAFHHQYVTELGTLLGDVKIDPEAQGYFSDQVWIYLDQLDPEIRKDGFITKMNRDAFAAAVEAGKKSYATLKQNIINEFLASQKTTAPAPSLKPGHTLTEAPTFTHADSVKELRDSIARLTG